jgi:hypothetical protein
VSEAPNPAAVQATKDEPMGLVGQVKFSARHD